MPNTESSQQFHALLDYMKHSRGFDFTGYKQTSLMRRVHKRMQEVGTESFGAYMDYLEVHPEEFVTLFNTILINVTAFFRDASAWDYLRAEIVPQLLAAKASDDPIRVWSAGCASGEEAYSLAMVLAEALGSDDFSRRVKIYATDVDEEALRAARQALYSARSLTELPPAWIDRYFEPIGTHFAFRALWRRTVIFGRHDLIQDAPISRLDLLVCRNTLMYFNAEIQQRILSRFHFALQDTGLLFLGKAEMLLTHTQLFTPLNLRHRIFAKVAGVNAHEHFSLIHQAYREGGTLHLARQVRLREVNFDTSPVAQVVLDINRTLVLANAQARLFFNLSFSDLGRPFHELELSYRPVDLRSRIDQVMTTRNSMLLRDIESAAPPPAVLRYLDVQVGPLLDNGKSLLGVSLTFTDVTHTHRLQVTMEGHRQELETAYEELQSINEELETTNEELQSTVEELETTNEELQSTNEELETMNEELQSTNEELQTVNSTIQQRTEALNRTNAFLQSILTSLRSAVVVLDQRLTVTHWNASAEELWSMPATSVQGQGFLHLDLGLPVEQVKRLLLALLSGDVSQQEMSLQGTNRHGQSIAYRVLGTPLLGVAEEIVGVILTLDEEGVSP